MSESLHYSQPHFNQFQQDLEAAGYSVEHYCGRFFYRGLAVRTHDVQEVIRATQVPVPWDNLGLRWIVYPKG